MSTVDYGQYKIGTIGFEGPKKLSQALDSLIPTYGLWGGPEWAGGMEVLGSASSSQERST
jgi:hypothetical protein